MSVTTKVRKRNARPAVAERDKTRSLLIAAGIKIFSRKGFDGATVKDLADVAGVNVSLVSYHFGGKEGLYRACLETFGSERLLVAEEILQAPASSEELRLRLGLFARNILDFQVNHKDVARMINRECESEITLTQDIFERTFLKIFGKLEAFFKASQKAGIIRKDVDVQSLSGFMIGTISNVSRVDSLNKRFFNQSIEDPKFRAKVTEQIIRIFVDGIAADKRSQK